MKQAYILFTVFILTSCVPTKIAPTFKRKGYKITKAKKFNTEFSKQKAFIFHNPRPHEHFYHYINNRLKLNHTIVFKYKSIYLDKGLRIPISIDNKRYYLSYNVAEKESAMYVFPIEAPLTNNYNYIVMTVSDANNANCLDKDYPHKEEIVNYLITLKDNYIHNPYYE